MYTRPVTGRELFTRNTDGSSERWSQQLDGSQDWPSQIYGSQDSQRLSAHPYRPPQVMMSSSQGSGSGRSMVGPPSGGRSSLPASPAPGVELRDLTLARDIRFGLHTILSVIRDLPEQLKEVSSEVSRASQEPELTRKLISDTSDNLQVLVSGLQDKLAHLVQNKEIDEDVHRSLTQREEQLSLLVAKVQDLSSEWSHQDQAKVVPLLKRTRKELCQELKKLSATMEEMKRVEPTVRSLQSDVSKMGETMKTEMEELRTSLINQIPPANPHADFITSTQQSLDQRKAWEHVETRIPILASLVDSPFYHQAPQLSSHQPSALTSTTSNKHGVDQVQATVKDLVEKISLLPKDVATQVGQVMREILQGSMGTCVGNSSSNSSSSLVSPSHRAFIAQRPMFPLAEGAYRCQISPVAHVSPLAQVSVVPPVTHHAQSAEVRGTTSLTTASVPLKVNPKVTPHSCPTPSCLDSNAVPSSCPTASQHPNPKGASQPKSAVAGNTDQKRLAQGVTTAEEAQTTGVKFQLNKCTEGTSLITEIGVNKDCCVGKALREEESMGCPSSRLEQDGTQHFTPQKTYTLIQLTSHSPGQETLVLDCDSSSSDDSPLLVSNVTAAPTVTHTDDWVEENQGIIKRPETNATFEVQRCNPFVPSQAAVAAVKREVMTPNVRKTPTMVIGGFKVRDNREGTSSGTVNVTTKEERAGARDEMMDRNSQPGLCKELNPHPFLVPAGPGSIKKRKPDNCHPQENEGRLMMGRTRRYLTPQTSGSLQLMFLQGNKKVTRET